MIGNILSPTHLLLVLAVALIVLGPKRLPEVGRGLGSAIRDFDVDGVLVDSPHERAWRDSLKELMETKWSDLRPSSSYSPERFTPQVYQQVMSGQAAVQRRAGGARVLRRPGRRASGEDVRRS